MACQQEMNLDCGNYELPCPSRNDMLTYSLPMDNIVHWNIACLYARRGEDRLKLELTAIGLQP